jgi:hypothetical protein
VTFADSCQHKDSGGLAYTLCHSNVVLPFRRVTREAAFLRPEARSMTDREDDLLSSLRGNVSNNAQSSVMFLLPSLRIYIGPMYLRQTSLWALGFGL